MACTSTKEPVNRRTRGGHPRRNGNPRVISLICVLVRANLGKGCQGDGRKQDKDILGGILAEIPGRERGLEKPARVRLYRGTITEGLGCLMARWRPTIVTSQVVGRDGRG